MRYVCNSKKSKFINKQEASGLLSKLGIKTTLSTITRRYFILNEYNNE